VTTTRTIWHTVAAWICLIGLVFFWVSQGEIIQSVQSSGKDKYEKPLFISWTVQLLGLPLLPAAIAWKWWYAQSYPGPLVPRRLIIMALYLLLPIFFCSYFWALSLSRTTVSANVIVYNSQCVFVFVLGVFFLHSPASALHVLSVVLCMGGVCVVSLFSQSGSHHSKSESSNSLLGFVFVILSTLLYSIYQVAFQAFCQPAALAGAAPSAIISKRTDYAPLLDNTAADDHSGDNHSDILTRHHDSVSSIPGVGHSVPVGHADSKDHPPGELSIIDTMLFLGLIAVTQVFALWPLLGLWHVTDLERFRLPPDAAMSMLWINSGMSTAFNIFLALGILWSSSLFISVGSLLTVPVSVVADKILHDYSLPAECYAGMVMIVVGFLGLLYADNRHALQRSKTSPVHVSEN